MLLWEPGQTQSFKEGEPVSVAQHLLFAGDAVDVEANESSLLNLTMAVQPVDSHDAGEPPEFLSCDDICQAEGRLTVRANSTGNHVVILQGSGDLEYQLQISRTIPISWILPILGISMLSYGLWLQRAKDEKTE